MQWKCETCVSLVESKISKVYLYSDVSQCFHNLIIRNLIAITLKVLIAWKWLVNAHPVDLDMKWI